MDGNIPADIVGQSRLAWQNLEAQLKAAGMTLDNLDDLPRLTCKAFALNERRGLMNHAIGD